MNAVGVVAWWNRLATLAVTRVQRGIAMDMR